MGSPNIDKRRESSPSFADLIYRGVTCGTFVNNVKTRAIVEKHTYYRFDVWILILYTSIY